ncbi:MAG: right-handed parallel beta-helix repeat-containing protein [Anaerolineales bacterium]|nr:right-handed parallel beta-helix repeat-containing protein [Anaerolineales bacterium]
MRSYWHNQRLLSAALVLALTFAAFTPAFFSVYADEPAPEPTAESQETGDAPAEEAPPPAQEAPAEVGSTSTQGDEAPPAGESASEGDEVPPAGESAFEEPASETPIDEPAADSTSADQANAPLPDPYFYISGALNSFTAIQDAIDYLATNGLTPDENRVYVEAQNFTENPVIDGDDWDGGTSTPDSLELISDGDSSNTTITGSLTIRNMLDFLLRGFTITEGFTATDNSGTMTLDDVVVNNTTSDGIVIETQTGDVVLQDVEANGNAGVGAYVDATGNVTINSSTFNDNNTTATDGEQGGLQVFADGEVLLEDVQASGNLDGDGAWVEADGITVHGGSYNNNTSPASEYGNGLYLESDGGPIYLQGVEASGNEEDGAAAAFSVADLENIIEIKFSRFKDNQGFGVFADPESGSVMFKCNQFANNTLGSILVPVGETVTYLPCPGSCDDEEKPVYLGVKLSETEPTIINPGNGTLVIIPPIVKTDEEEIPRAKVLALLEKELPADLLEDDTFLAGLNILLLNALLPDDAYENEEHQITIEFYIPAYKMERTFAVLFWDADAGAWEEIPFELIPHERKPGGKIVAHWPEPGIFVLVERASESE